MSRLIKKLKEGIKSPRHGLELLIRNTCPQMVPDKLWIQFVASIRFGKKLNLDTPQTFNEKMNWLKLHDRNPLYTIMADKYEVKEYVKSIIGVDFVVPCYGVWDSFDEIDFSKLPNQFVLKCTHDSSGAIVCHAKDTFDMAKARKHFNRYLKKNSFWHLREWVYKDIPPRIVADQFLDDGSGHELRDYKFWCFNGEPKIMYCTNKAADIYENFYDMDFQPLDVNHGFRRQVPEFEKPHEFELMQTLAQKLSKDIPFVRIDFFDVNGHVYFGEFTFYDWGGMQPFADAQWDECIGSWIQLPNEQGANRNNAGCKQ